MKSSEFFALVAAIYLAPQLTSGTAITMSVFFILIALAMVIFQK